MSASLGVELATAPLERVSADLVIVSWFENERPLRGGAARADWRLCGLLSDLIRSGRLSGARGEAVLLATRGGLAAPRLIALGLGDSRAFGSREIEASFRDGALRAVDLGCTRIAIAPPDAPSGRVTLAQRLESAVTGVVAAANVRDAQLLLTLVPDRAEREGVAEMLPAVKPRPLPARVELRLPAPAPRRRRAPGVMEPPTYPGFRPTVK